MNRYSALLTIALSVSLWGQRAPDAKPLVLANDKLEFTVSPTGARFNKLVMKGGDPISPIAAIGHFLALACSSSIVSFIDSGYHSWSGFAAGQFAID